MPPRRRSTSKPATPRNTGVPTRGDSSVSERSKVLSALNLLGFWMIASCAVLSALAWANLQALQRLEDVEQIKHFAHMYCRGIDRVDTTLILNTFTEDAEIDIPNMAHTVDPQNFTARAAHLLQRDFVMTQHLLANPTVLISDDGRTASSEIYFTAHHWKIIDGEIKDAGSNGRYLDRWRRSSDGKFRVYKRVLVYDWEANLWKKTIENEVAASKDTAWAPSGQRSLLGKNSKDDVSYQLFGNMLQV